MSKKKPIEVKVLLDPTWLTLDHPLLEDYTLKNAVKDEVVKQILKQIKLPKFKFDENELRELVKDKLAEKILYEFAENLRKHDFNR